MNITVAQLVAAGVAPTQARIFCEPLTEACLRFDIATPARVAAFLGQCMVESDRLIHTEENLYYSDPARVAAVFPREFPTAASAAAYAKNPARLGARVYAGREGNGDEASGDGYRYRGRGLLQITGREKYADAANGLAHDYLGQPDLVARPPDACLTAAWFWHTNKLNALADAGAFDAITRAVNGRAMLLASLRKQYTQQALSAVA
jgi:putative chitinase